MTLAANYAGRSFVGRVHGSEKEMLTKLKIERFKSARDVPLEFGRVNLFIGGNGAGKSNVLEAIGMVAAALSRGVTDIELTRKGVRLTPPALMKSAFKNDELPRTLRIEAEFSGDIAYEFELTASDRNTHLAFFSERALLRGEPLFGRSGAGFRVNGEPIQRTLDRHRSLWDQAHLAFDFPQQVLREFEVIGRFAIYAPQTEFLREIKSSTASEPPVGLHGEGLALAVASLIGQENTLGKSKRDQKVRALVDKAFDLVWLPGWAETVKVDALDPLLKSREITTSSAGRTIFFIDKYMHERRNHLSAYDSSEGTLFLLFIAVLLVHGEAPPIFALDNVDNALNPALTRKMLERVIEIVRMKRESKLPVGPEQVFFTSHNPTALDAFDLFDDDQRVFIVARDAKGYTKVTRLKPKAGMSREEWLSLHRGRKLSQLWIDGEIRGALGEV